jgi:hypothetical protein
MRSDVDIVLQAAKRLMRERPTIDVGIALHWAGDSSSQPYTARLLDDLLSLEERISKDVSVITRLRRRPEAYLR